MEIHKRRRGIIAACVLIGLVLAGCAGPPPVEPDGPGQSADGPVLDRAFFEQASGASTLEDAVGVLYRRCDEDDSVTDKEGCRDAVVTFFETEPVTLVHLEQAGCRADVESDHLALSGRECVANFHLVASNNRPVDPGSVRPDGRLPEGSGIASGSVPSPSGSTAPPQVERTGTESTGPTETEPSVFTPRLPIGGNPQNSGEAAQCAQVSFLGQDENSIPPGVSIVVTGAVFARALFTVGGSACEQYEDDPPCLGGFIFTADHTGQCQVPVHTDVTRPSADDDTSDQLRLTGRLECPDGQEAQCRELARRLEHDNQGIDLFPPVAETSETSTESTETTPTEPTETTSTEPTETTTTVSATTTTESATTDTQSTETTTSSSSSEATESESTSDTTSSGDGTRPRG